MKKLRIHYFQHAPYEGLGSIEEWALLYGHSLTSTLFFENQKLPELSGIDWLIIMGGPMSVNDEKHFPWLAQEKKFIRQAIDSDKIVLGICLGSQLVSAALGAKVYPNNEKEIGWFDIELTVPAKSADLFKSLGDKLKVFHWHGDTFDLPEDAILLASSAATKNQAYLYHERVLALQFHLETDSLEEMIGGGSLDLPGKFVQSENEILSYRHLIDSNKKVFFEILTRLAEKVSHG
jgi:GMP synthase-like glutamine amidotransferase